MDHEKLRESVLLLRDGELSASERFAVEEHLKECPSCRQLAVAVETIGPSLFNDAKPPASEQFISEIMSRIDESAEKEIGDKELDLPLRWWVPAFSFGLAGAVLLAAMPWHRQTMTMESLFAARANVDTGRVQDPQVAYLSDLLAVQLEER